MSEQLTFLTEEVEKSLGEKLLKRKWENAFQKWSDKNGMDGYTSLGACGYGSMCDYCEGDPSKGRPCVRALNAMLRETGEKIDYENASFEDVWEGEMYLSPIVIEEKPITYKLDDAILSAVGEVGIHVDKDELLKALEYDRDQYSKGFIDGYNRRMAEEQDHE